MNPSLTAEDFHAVPEMLTGAERMVATTTSQGLPAVEFHQTRNSRAYLLVTASWNKQGQVQMKTLKKSKPENRAS